MFTRIRDRTFRDTNEQRLDIILDELKDHVKHNAGIFSKFVDILRENFHRNDLADEIMSKLH